MLTKTIIAASALLSMTAAVPLQQLNKRDVVWETSTTWDVTTVDVTTTIWLEPGEKAPAGTGAPEAPAHFGHHHGGHKPKHTSHIQQTVTVQPQASSQAAPSSPYVAPSPSSPAPAPSSPAPAPSSPAAPDTTTWQAPPPSPSPQPSPSGGSGGSPSGSTYTGDITHYDVGLGSCGFTNNDSEDVVAIPIGMMNNPANPNANPLCGQTITISYAGQEHTAKIVDTCGGCSGASIDLSPTLFKAVAPSGDGRVHGVKWWYNN